MNDINYKPLTNNTKSYNNIKTRQSFFQIFQMHGTGYRVPVNQHNLISKLMNHIGITITTTSTNILYSSCS